MELTIDCFAEPQPERAWQSRFQTTWDEYRAWYVQAGLKERPGYLTCSTALEQHMPELAPIYHRLCNLVGGGDLESRFLSLYGPPPFMSGCSQACWLQGDPVLVRNYDYHPDWFEGVMVRTDWCRPVIGMSDCCWGLLDGMNDAGLAVALAFGGRRDVGEGFGIPLILRYLLETCATVNAAITTLRRLPVHMAYNVTLLDASGEHALVFVGPGRRAVVTRDAVSANHQETIDWLAYARRTKTVERTDRLNELLAEADASLDSITAAFLQAPLYATDFAQNFGTLYTAAWSPASGQVCLLWPEAELTQSFADFQPGTTTVHLLYCSPVCTRWPRRMPVVGRSAPITERRPQCRAGPAAIPSPCRCREGRRPSTCSC